jgi:hypothetical protein
MEINQEFAGHEAIKVSLDSIFRKKIFELANAPSVWKSILPQECYDTAFSYYDNTVNLVGREAIGAFKAAGLKEDKAIPQVDFALTYDHANIYTRESSIVYSRRELQYFDTWFKRAGVENSTFINQKVRAAQTVYEAEHNDIFLNGSPGRTKGLLYNPNVVDVSSLVGIQTKLTELITKIVSLVRGITNKSVFLSKLFLTPDLFYKLTTYYESSDKSNLEKLMAMPLDSGTDGSPQKLSVQVLDALTKTVTTANPDGYIYMITNDPSDFLYLYKPLTTYPTREYGSISYVIPLEYRHSDVYVFRKYSIVKCLVPANIT